MADQEASYRGPGYNEKESYGATYDVGSNGHDLSEAERERDMVNRKGSTIGEAAVLYGDVQTAEHYGYVTRGLKARHIQFIALGGTIGTGLFLGIGTALGKYGPLSILLGYSITGVFIYGMMQSLGEMVTWLPLPGAIPQIAHRYVDPAMGFAVGWNQWYQCALTQCSEISAAATLIGFWDDGPNPINVAAWISILIVLIICLNIFAVSIYGEAEFVFASVKLVTIVGLLILALIIDAGGIPPRYDPIGFRYWHNPGSMKTVVDTGNTGRFLSFFSTLVNAAFSYGGIETIAVAAGEAENPRKNIPKAVRRTFWRILFFYVLGSLAIGVITSSDDSGLLSDSGNANASPWVIGIRNAGITVLPDIINAVILTSAASSGNAFLFAGSRYLFALAQNGQAPRFLLKCSKAGVPIYCVIITALIACLTYLSAGSGGPTEAFGWFLNLTTIASLFTWVSICVAAIRFRAHIKAQGVSEKELPFRSPFQPYIAWASLIFFSIIILFNGWRVFTHGGWDKTQFITAYIGIPIYFGLFLFWKILKRTKWVSSAEADLWTGKAAIDAEVWPEQVPRNFIERVWYWIA